MPLQLCCSTDPHSLTAPVCLPGNCDVSLTLNLLQIDRGIGLFIVKRRFRKSTDVDAQVDFRFPCEVFDENHFGVRLA